MRVRFSPLRSSRPFRLFAVAGAVALVYPLQASAATSTTRVPGVAVARLVAPSSVAAGQPAELRGRLSVLGRPLAGRDVVFQVRPSRSEAWQTLGTATTGVDGWAGWQVPALTAPEQFSFYYAGIHGMAATRSEVATVHVIDLHASAPHKAEIGRPVRLAARLTMDGRGVARQPIRFMFRPSAHQPWRAPHWDTANRSGWARLVRRSHSSFQVGMRFDGASGLAPSPLVVARVRVVRPPRPAPARASGFVFPFQNPAQAMPTSAWSQDQGVDLAANGNACGSAAVLVAVGDGVVIQEGIEGFGPTAPVLQMTSGPFAGRNVYYGHTGRVFPSVGDHVRAGQRVAEIGCGSVGYSASPHLEIGVGEPGGPPCCPATHATSAEMWHWLVASLST